MALLDRLEQEWPLILAAPYTHWLLLLAILGAAVWIAHLWNRREMKAIKAEGNLKDERIAGLKTENEKLSKEIEKKGKTSTPIPVEYGSASIQDAFLEIRTPGHAITFYGTPKDWSARDITRFAAFTRLQETGLAKIENLTIPTVSSVVSGTSAAFEYANTPLPVKEENKN